MEISDMFNEELDIFDILGTSFADSASPPPGCIETPKTPAMENKKMKPSVS